jgi:imidazolonepropionase
MTAIPPSSTVGKKTSATSRTKRQIHEWDSIWLNATLLTMEEYQPMVIIPDEDTGLDILFFPANLHEYPLTLIPNGAIAVKDGRIAWLGGMENLPLYSVKQQFDAGGKLLTPGLIDCHTHLVYAGNRAHEFEARLEGKSYAEISAEGGGILSTVRATRAASEQELLENAKARALSALSQGVTTLEIKSGYGLDAENELKMLRAARKLGKATRQTIRTTLLAAHAVPPEFKGNSDGYVESIIQEILPRAKKEKLADAVDAFCESIAFSPAQVEKIFNAAQKLKFPLKLHAEQLSALGGSKLLAEFGGLSADHLEFATEEDIEAMSEANTVAVLLPAAFYFLKETKLPPVRLLHRYGVPIAIASDHNPGTSPIGSYSMVMNMACTLFGLTVAEAWRGMTIIAAQALGMDDQTGSLEVGKRADFALWDTTRPAEIIYRAGDNLCTEAVIGGAIAHRKE